MPSKKCSLFPTLAVVTVAAGILAFPMSPALAGSGGGGGQGGSVSGFYGGYSTDVKIEVPGFHGIEPKIALSYSSSGGNSIAGVGWNLAGFSSIERSGANRGSPNYNSTDIFFLDGQELVPCTTMGGTHCTKLQSYLRIQKDVPSADKWTVTAKDGVKSVFIPVMSGYGDGSSSGTTTPQGTYRYALDTVTDASGNVVNYDWWCDGVHDCYPSEVNYNGAQIVLYRETRADKMTFSTGRGVAKVDYRLKSIAVKVSGSLVRAYALTYNMSTSTKRSLLTAVQMYGRTSSVSSSGVVSGGLSMPATTFTYQGGSTAFENGGTQVAHAYDTVNLPCTHTGTSTSCDKYGCTTSTAALHQSCDKYGCTLVSHPTQVACTHTVSSGPKNWSTAALLGNNNAGSPTYGSGNYTDLIDMDGDGRLDYVSYYNWLTSTYGLWVLHNNGSGFDAPVNWNTRALLGNDVAARPAYSSGGTTYTQLIDMNADGLPDYVSYYNWTKSKYGLWVLINNGSGFDAPVNWRSAELLNVATVQVPIHSSDTASVWTCDKWGCSWVNTTVACTHMQTVASNYSENSYPSWNGGNYSNLIDMNGDGLPDYVSYYSKRTSQFGLWVLINNGSGFNAAVNWNTRALLGNDVAARPSYNSGTVYTELIDMNGDGKPDYVSYYNWLKSKYGMWVLINNGSGFNAPVNWRSAEQLHVATVQSPIHSSDTASVWTCDKWGCSWVNTTVACTHMQTLPSNYSEHSYPSWSGGQYSDLVDMNGDGRPDYVAHYNYRTSQYGLWVLLNTGSSFAEAVNWNTRALLNHDVAARPSYNDGSNLFTQLVDMTSDGLPDYVSYHNWTSGSSGFGLWVLVNTGAGFSAPVNWNSRGLLGNDGDARPSWGRGSYTSLRDIDGDGRIELLAHHNYGTGQYGMWVLKPNGELPDMLSVAGNGIGGTTTIGYTPSSAWDNTNNPPIMQTVTSLATDDGRGNVSTIKYSYAGGLYDRLEGQFLGFRYAKQTSPCLLSESLCPYTETWFNQSYGSAAKAERVDLRDGAGVLLSTSLSTYVNNGATVPYTSLEAETWQYMYDGTGASCPQWASQPLVMSPCANAKRTYATRSYDAYGNNTQETVFGDYDVAGDEKTMRTWFVPNASTYRVNWAARVDTFDGTSTAGTLLAQSLIYYDGATSWNAAPTKGLATNSCSLVTGSSYICATMAYDGWGNVIAEADALGNQKTGTMDSTYHQFPLVTTNAKGQTASTTWDAVCGKPLTMTDLNGGVTSFQYDALCRETRVDTPDGGYEITTAYNLGNAATQYVQVERPGANGSGNLWTRTYADGLGRTWRTDNKGPTAAEIIREDTEFDARGNGYRTTGTYYANTTPVWTTVLYDALERVVRMTNPDGTYETRTYGLGVTTTTDEMGRQRQEHVDSSGRAVLRREMLNGQWVSNAFSYNQLGHLLSTTDAAGNVATYTYDMLGRKLSQSDPDAGYWTYVYDARGLQTLAIDAKGQRTEQSYDQLGRRIQKVTKLAGGAVERTVTWTYDEARTGYKNIGKVTTMTDPSGAATFNYNVAGKLVEGGRTIDGTSYRFSKGYDTGGRLKWTTYPDADTVGTAASPLGYDDAGRLSSIPGYVNSTTYTAWGQVLTQNNANGTVLTRTYDAGRRWVTGVATVSGATTLQNLAIARNTDGMITSITSPFANESWGYSYDGMGRLVTATNTTSGTYSQTFAYDAVGNMTSNSRLGAYGYNAAGTARPHATVTAGSNTYTYDANGSMVSGAGRTIAWNVDNQPTAISGSTFVYDAEGSRLEKIVSGQTTRTLGDDYEIAPNGVVTKHVSLDGRLVAKKVGATKYWLHADHQGSVQVVTNSSGAEQQRLKYRAYGDRLSTGTAHAQSRGYTGQRQDETGLFYLHARYYDPILGRFISADPTVPTDRIVGLNRYAYGANDPVNHTDIDGLGFFKKLFKAIKKIFKSIVKVLKAFLPVLLGMVPGIGWILQLAYMAYVASQAPNPWKTFAVMLVARYVGQGMVPPGTGASLAQGALYVGKQALLGGATAYGVARVNGVPHAMAMKAARSGALAAGAFAAANVFYNAIAGMRPQDALKGDGGNKFAPGSKVANPIKTDGLFGEFPKWWHDNVSGEHSAFMKFTGSIGIGNVQAALHDPLQTNLFPGSYTPGTRDFLNTGFWADLPMDIVAVGTNVISGQVSQFAIMADTGWGMVEIGNRVIAAQAKAEAQARSYYASLASASGQGFGQ